MGRRGKFNEVVCQRIYKALEAGSTYEIAAEYAGISRQTFYIWMKKGKSNSTGQFVTFVDNVKRAEAVGAISNLETIKQASKKDWKASAWILERRFNYHRDGVHRKEDPVEVQLPTNTYDLLKEQAVELKRSMMKAEASQSWQAYAALQRQLLQVVQQIRQIESEQNMGEELDGFTDEQLLQEITTAIVSLPPILRQRLEGSIMDLSNVVPLEKNK